MADKPFVGDDDHGPDALLLIADYRDRIGGDTYAQTVMDACWREISLLRDILLDRSGEIGRLRDQLAARSRQNTIADEIVSSEPFAWLMVGANHPQIHLDALKPAWVAWRESGGKSVFSPDWKPYTPPQNPSTPAD